MRSMLLKTSIALALVGSATFATVTHAVDEYNVGPGLTYVGAPLALRGVDPVAFVEIGNRIPGQARYAVEHDGVAYYFATESNQKQFKDNPQRYLPQNGGFCTYGVALGKKFDGDPSYAAVLNKKLYVFLNEGVYREFLKDQQGTIKQADTQWKKIKHTAAVDL